MGRPSPKPLTPRLVLDTGALIALERGDVRLRALLRDSQAGRYAVVVPVLVAMEALFGARSTTRVMQVLRAIDGELPLLPPTGHQAVGLRIAAGTGSDADACVVLEALAVPGSAIVSGDAADIAALLSAAGAPGHVPVLRV